jgi:hypothetical protein
MTDLEGKKKIRGTRRKMVAFLSRLESTAKLFPEEDRPGCGYWHTHMPVAQSFIDSISTPQSIRRTFIQAILDTTSRISRLKHVDGQKTRVVASINLPSLFDSQIIVFFGDDYYSQFFNRNSTDQRWTPLPPQRNLLKEIALTLPEGFHQKGFHESISDEDYTHEGEIWFFGEIA